MYVAAMTGNTLDLVFDLGTIDLPHDELQLHQPSVFV